MVILLMENVPAGLRGELSRWMIEPKAGVFIGKMSAMVRDKLWERACKGTKGGAATLFYSSQTEQGFTVRTHGEANRTLVDWEGLTLVRLPKRDRPPDGNQSPVGPASPTSNAAPRDWIPG